MNSRFDPKDARPAPIEPTRFGMRDTVREIDQPLSPTQARQGDKGSPILKVLLVGIGLALIVWGGAEWWGAETAPPAEQTATPPAGQAEPANPTSVPAPANTP